MRVVALPPLRRAIRRLIPPVVQNFAGPVVDVAAEVGLRALPPISRFISFFLGLELLKNLFLHYIKPEWAVAFQPIFGSISDLIKGFFATPKNVMFVEGFLERTIKVVAGSFLFGGFYIQFLLIFQKGGKRRMAFLYCCLFGFSVYIIFSDHRFVTVLVKNLIRTYPSIQQLLVQPFSQTCLLFSSGILIQSAFMAYNSKKTGIPTVVIFFYAWALWCSGLHYYILEGNIGNMRFFPKSFKK